MVSMRVVRTLVDAVAQSGVPQADFLRAAGLDLERFSQTDARLPRSELFRLFELALEVTGDPAFGLHSIEHMASDALNPIGALVVHSATLREALNVIQEFRGLLGDEASFRIEEEDGKALVRVDALPDENMRVRRFLAEVVIAGLFRTIRRFRCEACVDYVAFEYPSPDYEPEYARIFEGLARFERSFTGLSLDSRLLSAAAPHPDADLHQALRVFARRRVAQLKGSVPYAARVHQFLVWQRPPRDMRMAAVASALGVSARTLRRHLAAEGRSFASVLGEAQAVIAKSCLLDEQRTIVETAAELGFADATGFHRAFKRWTGLTPSQFRRQHADLRCSLR
jgi:AraC-like DNA-binding protein